MNILIIKAQLVRSAYAIILGVPCGGFRLGVCGPWHVTCVLASVFLFSCQHVHIASAPQPLKFYSRVRVSGPHGDGKTERTVTWPKPSHQGWRAGGRTHVNEKIYSHLHLTRNNVVGPHKTTYCTLLTRVNQRAPCSVII